MTFFFLIILGVICIAIFMILSRVTEKLFSAKKVSTPKQISVSQTAPISEETKREIAAVKAKLKKAALPYAEVIIEDDPAKEPQESRLGGPVYLPENVEWPCTPSGDKLLFLAQINFAQMPSIPDFPETGILQIFIASDDLFGADFDEPEKSQVKFIFHESFPDALTLHQNLPDPSTQANDEPEIYSPFQKTDVHMNGRALSFNQDIKSMMPDLTHWKYQDIADGIEDREAVYSLWDELSLTRPQHYVGGHISLTQWDFRYKPPYNEYDRIVLQLGSDSNIMWGDVGEMSLSMRKDDLVNKRFEKAIFYWDCC
jgi:uncharacterized protein YwqG